MKCNWVIAAGYDPVGGHDFNRMVEVGPSWGSWKTWRHCGTHNVICHELNEAHKLVKKSLQSKCNLYLPKKYYQDLGRPSGLFWYEGDFQEAAQDLEDVIAMHLVAPGSEIVLMIGFDLGTPLPVEDRYEKHRIQNRLGLIRRIISDSPSTQWVLIDHAQELDIGYRSLSNLTCDTVENVLQLLV